MTHQHASEPVGAFGEAVKTFPCRRCKARFPIDQMVIRHRYYSDGGQHGWDEVEVCAPCAEAIDADQEPGDSFYEGRG
jgi:hypothetical protein